MTLSITLIIVIITVIASLTAFSNEKVMNDLIFYPPAIHQNKQWYRFFTSGLIHGDYVHLAFNMIALYSFGSALELYLKEVFNENGVWVYLLLYISALFFSILPTYLKHKNNSYYRSLGASGAVSAVVFASIMFNPLGKIGIILLPFFTIPGFIFGFVYLLISSYLDKRGGDRINHSAHLFGSLFGIGFIIAATYVFSSYPLLEAFVYNIRNWINSF
ncbi:rhomboid family intramembrane serine protease [Gynurincola endophyticus]|jgi:membrane associated rhomboid family serine protease|uniref:rhomboid family intramembrane serine protease n=1 Tax=Gynurincola endophyticus TaxID=2479004 RepID=UPI000F8E0978|nr:rhomboid family intramembrane serine protease [Gynurincola endophyticus]